MNTAIADFIGQVSTEISTHDEGLLPALADVLPVGMTLYIAHTPKASLDDVVRVSMRAKALGFRPSPHIVARRMSDESTLREVLSVLTRGGIDRVLLIAGDISRPVGKFTSTLEVLDSGAFEGTGISHIGVAGHPEGHTSVSPDALLAALRHKQAFSVRTGLKVHIVTQFGFNPEAICAWDERMSAAGISLPVHVGIAGPTPLPKLLKFAMQCGVGSALQSLMKSRNSLGNLARMATTPEEMIRRLACGRAAAGRSRLLQPHFYSFGGAMATATWLRSIANGALSEVSYP
jgi:methylenetetrahydrofolate reductase (NADPH)